MTWIFVSFIVAISCLILSNKWYKELGNKLTKLAGVLYLGWGDRNLGDKSIIVFLKVARRSENWVRVDSGREMIVSREGWDNEDDMMIPKLLN